MVLLKPIERNIFIMKVTELLLEKAMRYGAKFQRNENSAQVSLFGDASEVQIAEPLVLPCEEWSTMEKLIKKRSSRYLHFRSSFRWL